jgi:hypothetical protein
MTEILTAWQRSRQMILPHVGVAIIWQGNPVEFLKVHSAAAMGKS